VIASAASSPEVRAGLAAFERQRGLEVRHVEHPGPVDAMSGLALAAKVTGNAPCIAHLASGLLADPLPPIVDRVRLDSPDVMLLLHEAAAPDEHLNPAIRAMLHVADFDPERAALGTAGIWIFGRGALRQFDAQALRSTNGSGLTMSAERIGALGGRVQSHLVDGWRRYSGSPLDLLEINQIALDRLETDQRRLSNNGNQIEGRVQIDSGASVRASVIVGPTVIGPGAHIADAYIGPYTSIGAGARVEGAEIERSVIAAGASITHVGGRLVSSVVGRDARVFRDFSLPRALRLRVGDGTEVALC
jgi:glucose-1-phosphate thymidylyltransferase